MANPLTEIANRIERSKVVGCYVKNVGRDQIRGLNFVDEDNEAFCATYEVVARALLAARLPSQPEEY